MHFSGDFTEAVKCTKEAIDLVRGGDYTSRTLYDHVFHAAGQYNALRPDDTTPTPVFTATAVPETVEGICDAIEAELPGENEPKQFDPMKWWQIAQLLLQLAQLLGKKN